ncbi:unnamed protein product [Microthlaspi erraticum]|uniref:Uncharacterized protein n=1 Tax=Microthlaspi erraticum TaxID=1685480 RepID=A0A6D2IY31_9BRAS|nr:unnamed protein product [Microthlaspi erraticum]
MRFGWRSQLIEREDEISKKEDWFMRLGSPPLIAEYGAFGAKYFTTTLQKAPAAHHHLGGRIGGPNVQIDEIGSKIDGETIDIAEFLILTSRLSSSMAQESLLPLLILRQI